VERSRMEFYVDRACKTRFVDGVEIVVDDEFQKRYRRAMARLFNQRPPPDAYSREVLFPQGRLNRKLFDKACCSLNMDSSPGYPFVYLWRQNSCVDLDWLYLLAEELMMKWMNITLEDFERLEALEAFERGLAYPAMSFVKGEPTAESKIARLIYGVALATNVVGRMLMGEYLIHLPETNKNAQHKVGLDMYTQPGLEDLFKCYDRLHDLAEKQGKPVDTNDIQGWEYQSRLWMSRIWSECYIDRMKGDNVLDGVHEHLLRCYQKANEKTLIIDSDGNVHQLPIYITLSGKPTTHIENSDDRDALADAINGFDELPAFELPSLANGDDCAEINVHPNMYNELGFVVTDRVHQLRDELNYCSQKFLRKDGKIVRIPDGLAKSFFNAMQASGKYDALIGIFAHVQNHPGMKAFVEAISLAHKINTGEESAELPFEVL
jgi:hypothetical protein